MARRALWKSVDGRGVLGKSLTKGWAARTQSKCVQDLSLLATLVLNVGTELAEAGGVGSATVRTSQRRETLQIPQASSLKTHQIHAS